MRVLVTGVSGQIGSELMRLPLPDGVLIPADRAALDLADSASITAGFDAAAPDVVVNCAAYTAVDAAETDRERAFLINGEGPGVLARLCAARGVPLIHFSTDFVFDGEKAGPYLPDDAVNPLGAYGASKEAGERAIRAATPHHIILRTSWVFASHGTNFVKKILAAAKTRDLLRVVNDERGRPTAARDAARAVIAVLDRLRREGGDGAWGTHHFCNGPVTTWHGLADAACEEAARYWGRRPVVETTTAAEYGSPTKRPKNSELDTTSFEATFGFTPADHRTELRIVVDELAAEGFLTVEATS